MTGLFSRNRLTRSGRVGPVILLATVVALQLTPAPAGAAGGTVTVDNVAVHEPADGSRAVVFTVTLTRSDADPVTVDYATLDGTATAGQDYVATAGSLDFGPAGTTRTVRVLVLGDALDEGDETFALRLTGASNGQTQLDATGTITDVDAPPRLSIADARVTESTAGPESGGPAAATFAVSLSEPSGQPVTVDYTTTDGAGAGGAAAPSDYGATAGALTFNPGERVKPVTVPVANDAVDEPAETFTVALANAAGATIGTGAGTGTIVDDDGPPALTVEDATAAEGAGRLTFRVALDRPSSRTVTFRVQTFDGPGPNAGRAADDYSALAGTPGQIPAGETSVAIHVALTDDQVHEAPETLSLVLSSEGNATIARPAATGTITDDDPGLDLSVADVTATEGSVVGDNLVFTVTLSPPAGGPVTVGYATADGTAVAEARSPDRPDYRAAAGTLTFHPAQTTKTVTVFLDHDRLAEGTETVLFTLTNPTGGAVLARPSATGTIDDDDGQPDELAVADIGFAEGSAGTGAHLFTVTRTRRSGGAVPPPVTVAFATADRSARAGSDYTPRTGVLLFAGPVTTQTISVSVTGDAVDEDDETFGVTLSAPTNAVLGKATGTATIRDDDLPPLVSVVPVTIAEGNSGISRGVAEVVLSSPASRPLTVDYSVGGGTAGPSDVSPDTATGTLTFEPGETAGAVVFSVTGDPVDEPDETFEVTISGVEGGRMPEPGPAAGLVTIADDDAPPGLSIGDEAISETDAGRRPVEFAVVLDEVSGKAVTVTAGTTDGPAPGGATAPEDYTAVTGRVVTVPAGTRAVAVPVSVADDAAADGAPSETFTLALSSPVDATLSDGTAAGTIVDDDGPATLAVAGDTVTEGTGGAGERARFLVTLSKESEQAVTVDYSTGDPATGSAPAATTPGDYTGVNATLTFNPGETAKTVTIPISPDDADEVDEALTLVLSNAGGGTPIDPARASATATIDDDDGPAVTVADVEVPEADTGAGQAVFTVTLATAAAQPVTVGYATANGTAAGGRDYTPTSGILTFPPGETSRTVAVAVTGDDLDEGDEDFFLGLGRVADATVADGAARAVLTNDDQAQVDLADAGLAEGDTGTATLAFTVTLTPPSSSPVTVAFATADQTATAGQDYEAATGRLTFNPGDRTKTVAVRVSADTTDKAVETFTVTLSAAGVARLGRATATGTILDDDDLPELLSPDVTVTEKTKEDATAIFPVRLSGPRSFPVTARYETRPGTASAGIDFTPVSGALTFAPGDEEKPVAVPVRSDSRFEGGETIRLHLSTTGPGPGAGPGAPAGSEATATILDDDPPGYLLAATDGGLFNFGGAAFSGSVGGVRLNSPIVGVASHPSGRGYWLVAGDGGVFPFGEAKFHGSAAGTRFARPIVGMAPTPTGNGYWLVTTDGGIFSFGDARFFGSTGRSRLARPIVGIAPTPTGQGYWLVATDGGIFAFGDARFFGSTGALALNRPIVGLAPTPTGQGYWLVATDGGIFAFGDARFFGSTGALQLNRPIVGLTPSPSGDGYWLVATDGGIFSFGDARFLGSTGALSLNKPVVGMSTL